MMVIEPRKARFSGQPFKRCERKIFMHGNLEPRLLRVMIMKTSCRIRVATNGGLDPRMELKGKENHRKMKEIRWMEDLQVFKIMLVCNPSNDKVFQICLELFQSARVDRSLACPRLYLTRRCVLDATIATAPPTGFSHSWGHRMVASSWTGFPAPWCR